MSKMPVPGDACFLTASDPIARLLRDLIHDRSGLYFNEDRLEGMLEKLQPRAELLGCSSFLDYYYVLKYEEQGPHEWRRVMDALSVQETYFWREFEQVRALVDHVVPEWFKRNDRPLRIWSAGCATGEEPYSMAMALEEAGWSGHPIEIFGSDASEAALAKARAGIYRERSFRTLPAPLRAKYFEAVPEGNALRKDLIDRVDFRWANLMHLTELGEVQDVQVIFCRNVFIYFSQAAMVRVVSAFGKSLPPRGHLFVGASESLLKLTDEFDLQDIQGAFVYVRRPSS